MPVRLEGKKPKMVRLSVEVVKSQQIQAETWEEMFKFQRWVAP
jgi:hypothetical protein